MPAPATPLLTARGLSSAQPGGAAFNELSLTVEHASFNVIVGGESAAGLRLLRILGLLERTDSGELFLENMPLQDLDDHARATLRNTRFGYVFAAPFLLGEFTVIENVAIPLFRISRADPPRAREWSEEMLDFVGIKAMSGQRVHELNLEQQMRVALARALVNKPSAIFVENLGALLPPESWESFLTLLRRACAHFSTAVVAAGTDQFELTGSDRRIDLLPGRASPVISI